MAEPADVTVLVVDDQPRFLEVAGTVVERAPGFTLAGFAEDGAAAVDAVRRLRPQLVLMDIHMPVLDGIAAAARIHDEWPGTVVVLLSSYASEDLPPAVRTSRAGYLRKEQLDGTAIRRAWEQHRPSSR